MNALLRSKELRIYFLPTGGSSGEAKGQSGHAGYAPLSVIYAVTNTAKFVFDVACEHDENILKKNISGNYAPDCQNSIFSFWAFYDQRLCLSTPLGARPHAPELAMPPFLASASLLDVFASNCS